MITVRTTQLCYCNPKAATDNINKHGGYVPIKIYLQKQTAGWNWPTGLFAVLCFRLIKTTLK